jgi:hypothetical protein
MKLRGLQRLVLAGLVASAVLGSLPAEAQTTVGTLDPNAPSERGRTAAPQPIPRRPEGAVNLGNTATDKGLWFPLDRSDLGRRSTLALVDSIPFQPWARALWDERQVHELEPHTRCHPSGVSRQFQTPYGVEFVQLPELQRIYIIDVGGPHTYREIYMDGRQHPRDLLPSSYGHSVGRWDGDTLVVDTVGFAETFWIDRTGLPHSEKLHTIERFTRTSYDTIKYEVEIEDPNVYTRRWSGGFNFRWTTDTDVFEYVCQDNNTAPGLMTNDGVAIEFKKVTVP